MPEAPTFETPPATPAGFHAICETLGAPKKLLLAVSGGSDSMALMHLAAPLAREAAGIFVATVDHGLRAAARREAAMVAGAARALGLPHATLEWTGARPSSQQAARMARYHLLADHAQEIGAEAIMTAHTADDQAETVLMRMARGSGPRGLSGMAADSLIASGAGPPGRLLRPLLPYRREALRAFLRGAGGAYVDDPTNEDPKFERVRIRRLLADPQMAAALSVESLVQAADQCRRAAQRLEHAENDRFRDLLGAFAASGAASLLAIVTGADAPLVARLIHAIGGARHPPGEAAVEEAMRRARRGVTATLGGARLAQIRDRLTIMREIAALTGRAGVAPMAPVALGPGESALWDRRFAVANPFGEPAEVRVLGEASREYGADEAEAEALASAPALWVAGKIALIAGDTDAILSLAPERFYGRVNRFP